MSRELQGNSGGLCDLWIVGCVDQQNARAVAIQSNRMQGRGQMPPLRRIPVWHAENLQPVYFNLLVAEDTDTHGGHGVQISAVVAELLMISGDEIYAMRRRKSLQRFCCLSRIDGRAVKQISGNKDCVRFFFQNLRNGPV